MTEREEFEIWCASVGFAHISLLFNGKMYADGTIQNMWVTWKAAKAQAVPQWIPVSERLPAYGDDVLIVAIGETVAVNNVYEFKKSNFSSEDYFDSNGEDGDYYYTRGVSHWMPLPAAPVKE